jgi:hypothetical protein
VALPLWKHLSRAALQLELRQVPQLEKRWKALAKKEKKAGGGGGGGRELFLPGLLDHFFAQLGALQPAGPLDTELRRRASRARAPPPPPTSPPPRARSGGLGTFEGI